MKDSMVTERGAVQTTTFARSLSSLKERGSNLLVVGPTDSHDPACERLLGHTDEAPRHRVVVRTESDARIGCRASHGDDPSVVTCDPEGHVDQIGQRVIDRIGTVERQYDGVDPAELRVCFEALTPLVALAPQRSVVSMLESVTDRVQRASGMGHYHLAADRDDRVVKELEPLFDAVIEVETKDGTPVHQWQLVDADVGSGWLPL